MTGTELITALETRIGNPSTDGFFSTAQKLDLVNEGLQVVSTEADWPWLQTVGTITTVAGTAAYAVASDYAHTKKLYISGYDPLEYQGLAESDSAASVDRGQPTNYTIYDEDIILRPTPDAVYSVLHQFMKQEPAVAAGTSPIMPTQFHYVIVAKAAELAHMRQGYMDRAANQNREYKEWLARMLDYRRRTRASVSRRVRPGSAW